MSVAGATAVPTARHGEAAARDSAGLLLARLSVAPALLATAFLLASFPLLAAGAFRPVPVIVIAVIVAAVLVPLGLRRVPGLVPPPDAAGRPGGERPLEARLWALPGDPDGVPARRTPWWALWLVVVIAAGFFAFAVRYHSQFLLITRDPGTYMQYATWIAGHGKATIPSDVSAFGGAKGINFSGFAMYPQANNTIIPQFMAGLPMTLAVGFWLGGVNAALLLAPLFGALAIIVFAGLVARLAGPRWAPLGALALAATEPLLFTSKSTYSEPLALILFIGGLSLVIDCLRARRATPAAARPAGIARGGWLAARVARWDSARVLALLAGLALGISLLVRIDAPADELAVIPYAGLLLARRQRQGWPLIIGLAIGWAWGWYDAVFVTFPYVFETNKASSLPMLALLVVTLLATVAGIGWLRRRVRAGKGLPQPGQHWYLPRWLPWLLVIAPFVVLAGFGARSHFQADYVAQDYVQLSLHWVYWYIGGAAIALAGTGVALLGPGVLRGRWPAWALPLMSFCFGITLFLYRPGITPDQPWASRRLVPLVLPGFITLALWAVAWACGKLRRGEIRGASRVPWLRAWLTGSRRRLTAGAVASACAVAIVVPAIFGGLAIAPKRTFTGEVAAVYGLCAQIPANASVIIMNGPLADRWSQVVRGTCDVPVGRFADNSNVYKYPTAATSLVAGAIAGVQRAGRQPVVLAATSKELAPFASTGTVTHAVNVKSTMDGRSLESKAYKIATENLSVWMWEPTR